jgi:hypothetical protein
MTEEGRVYRQQRGKQTVEEKVDNREKSRQQREK